MNFELLNKPLYQLLPAELEEIKAVADVLFARLCRPFQLTTERTIFSYEKTIRTALKLGAFLPQYEKTQRHTNKSRLVIAMSLSGIDRCYAVGLIPLLFQLQKVLNFKFFIYTDDLIPAVFTEDGFLENDIDIAWNNSNWANMVSRLGSMTFDKREDHLLIIDSLGSGGDSKVYNYWTETDVKDVKEAQEQYLTYEWQDARRYVGGNYTHLNERLLPRAWNEIVNRNCKTRWVDAPAMKQYLIRWLLHQQFGRIKHGSLSPSGNYFERSTARLRDQFASIHLLTPTFTEESKSNLLNMMHYDFIDFHHEADTLEGVSKVFVNIIFRKETKRLRTPKIVFGSYEEKVENIEEDEEGEVEHSNLLKGSKCFSDCKDVDQMPDTSFKLTNRKRGRYVTEDELIPFNEIDVTHHSYYRNELPSLVIKSSWSAYSKEKAAQEWLNTIKQIELYCYQNNEGNDESDSNISTRSRKPIPAEEIDAWMDNIDFTRHRTNALRPFVREMFNLYAPSYFPYIKAIPLKNVVWCTRGIFNHAKVSLSSHVTTDKVQQQQTIWHEFAHYVNFVCPLINVFDNQLLRTRTGKNGSDNKADFIRLNQGEYALSPLPEYPPWITPYAGKYYKRIHRHLCNETEIIPCYLPELISPSRIIKLYESDEQMLFFIAFVLCGGPLAYFQLKFNNARRNALREIRKLEDQMTERAMRAVNPKKRGRPAGSSSSKPSITYTPSSKSDKFSFGL